MPDSLDFVIVRRLFVCILLFLRGYSVKPALVWNDDGHFLLLCPGTYFHEKALPSNYWYQALELSDEAISFLIHAFAIRGMNGVIIHGDALEMAVKQVYFIQNSANNPIGFSEINVIPHSKDAMEFLGIHEWTEQAIEHIESKFPDWIPLTEEKKEQMSLFDECEKYRQTNIAGQ